MKFQIMLHLYNFIVVWHTASGLTKVLGGNISSISSMLMKLVDEGLLRRKKGIGPRGGYGYTLSAKGRLKMKEDLGR